MQNVFYPENVIEAHLLKGLLEQHGIDCLIRGEYLQGGIGELPTAGMLIIAVDEADIVRTHEVLDAYEGRLLA